MFKIIMSSKHEYLVNEEEYKAIMKAEKGMFISRLNVFISKSFIATAFPENMADQVEDKKKQLTGRLHDGGRVKRYYGQWIMDNGLVPDDNGNYQPILPDVTYYPEISKDCVFTETEYEKVKHLPVAEIKKMISSGERQITDGLEPINKLLK